MKNLLLIVAFFVPAAIFAKPTLPPNSPQAGRTYYVSPTGNDHNDGAINTPFKTWTKLASVLTAGDLAYIRGGTYYSSSGADAWQHCDWENMHGTETDTIHIFAYPGEQPILDLSNFEPTNLNPSALLMKNCTYVHVKGLRITGLKQESSGNGISRGFVLENSSNNKIEQIELDHIGGYGFMLGNGSNDNLFLNCDAHHMDDRFTNDGGAWGNSNGFQCTGGSTATRNTFDGCRAWWISDDGFDLYGTNGVFTFKNCWSFWNGYEPGTFNSVGDGDGFKMGPDNSGNNHNNLLRTYENCVAFENAGSGFDQNNGDMRYQMYNNTSFKNGSYGYMFDYISPAPVQDMKNNVSFLDVHARRGNETNGSHNSWNLTSSLTSSDFLNINSSGMDGPRQPDGSLPHLNFLRPSSTSRLLNAGIDVGLPFNGDAPEIGAFEVITASQNSIPVANAGEDQTLQLPLSVVSLHGTGTDTDGTITGFQWVKISGPANGGYLANSNAALTTITSLVAGSFQYELTVTDNGGASAKDTVTITILAAANIPPVAYAGNDQWTVLPDNSISLNGSGTDADGEISSYYWQQVSGPSPATIAEAAAPATDVYDLVEGVYIFRLTVTDDYGTTATDETEVTVTHAANQLPTADAGPDQFITLPNTTVTLTGSGTDADGNISSYSWVKISGPSGAIIGNPNVASTSVTGLIQGNYTFQLTVTDDAGASASDLVKIIVNPPGNIPPVADAGPDMEFSLPTNSVTLNGTASDPDGTITATRWRKLTGPYGPTIQNNTWPTTNVNGFVAGTYTYEFRATDNHNAVTRDTMKIVVWPANQPPIANAGENQVITLPQNYTLLSGTGVDADGEIIAYHWAQISGPANANLTSADEQETEVTNLEEGVFVFQLTVTDNLNTTAIDQVSITVNPLPNQPPAVYAGANISITLPQNSVSLNGMASDADGSISFIEWTQISGSAQAEISSPNSLSTDVINLEAGVYEFVLTVTDDGGASASSLIQVTVNEATPQPNQPPVSDAGPDFSITLPLNQTPLTGSGTDEDGSIIAYSWRKLSGPNGATISNATSATCMVSGLVAGTYRFELKVADNNYAINRDTMTLTVLPAPNILPSANAGNDITLTLPVNNTSLNGSGNDIDGYIVSYHWQKVSGPSAGTIANPNNRITTVFDLWQGMYVFELTVTDNRGDIGKDSLTITVLPRPNQPPTVNTGANQTITLPQNSTTLSGSANDPDGSVVSVIWSQVSGPSVAVISTPETLTTPISNLEEGNYVFQLLVTDDDGASAFNQITVHVNPAPNQPPVANAGSDQTIQLPAEYAQLQGSGSDADGTIISYSWRLLSGPNGGAITNPSEANTLIVVLNAGVYHYELTVTDDDGAMGKDSVNVTVIPVPNQQPVVYAGADTTITLPQNSMTLTGTATDPDGYITSYNWSQLQGPAPATLSGINQPALNITGLTQGVYRFIFSAWDNQLLPARDTVAITVLPPPPNQLPVVSAGPDITTTLPINSSQLQGSATDSDGSIVSLLWSQAGGPSQATISNGNSLHPNISNLISGSYYFVLRATDNMGGVARDTMQFTVHPAPNVPPVANAGPDQTITLPLNATTVYGSGADADGSIIAYQWEKISGGNANIISPALAATSIQGLQQGTYYFRLTVTDNSGATARDTLKIMVLPAPNQPPVANAGPDQSITLPVNSIQLNGTGEDADGEIVAYLWEKISGGNANIISPALAATSIQGLQQGTYYFRLTVTDNSGATARDTLKIMVLPAPNQPPVANAGPDQSITLPVNSIQLNGTGEDADGEIVAYQWVQLNGPSNVLQAWNQASVSIEGLQEGEYQFEFRVTDDDGAVAKDTVQVIVYHAINQPPVADAGNTRTLVLPDNSINITGQGYDPDGVIDAYGWQIISSNPFTATGTDQQVLNLLDLQIGDYTLVLTVTDNDGASATDTVLLRVFADPRVTIKGTPQLDILGNPFYEQLNVRITWNGENECSGSLYLYNINGEKLLEQKVMANGSIQIFHFNSSAFIPGTYILKFKSSCTGIIIKKLSRL